MMCELRARRRRQRGAVALWVEQPRRRALILRFVTGVCHGRRLPARDEDHGHLVPRGPRPRHRHPDRRAHRGLGGAAPDPRPHRPAVAARLARGLAPGHRRRRGRLGRSSRRARTAFPRRASICAWRAPFFHERGPRLACFGYFGHMWELYSMWAWLGLFLAASLEAHGGGSYPGPQCARGHLRWPWAWAAPSAAMTGGSTRPIAGAVPRSPWRPWPCRASARPPSASPSADRPHSRFALALSSGASRSSRTRRSSPRR